MKLRLIKKKQENSDTISFLFKPEESLIYKAGQYLRYHIKNPSPDERGENRFFSISSAPFENIIRLSTKFALNGSTFKKDLQALSRGDTVEVSGPYGKFSAENTDKEYVFIAGGIGITPFRSILLDWDHNNRPIKATLIYATRNQEALFKEELLNLAEKHNDFKIYQIISGNIEKPSKEINLTQLKGRVDGNLIKKLIPEMQNKIYYISGPEEMVMELEEVIWNLGVPEENTKRDYFPGYGNY
jgi:ferredoxin-NADP reductase